MELVEDPAGKGIAFIPYKQVVHRRSDPMLRAGDLIPVSVLIYKDKLDKFPEIAKKRLSYKNIQTSSVPCISYAPSLGQPFT